MQASFYVVNGGSEEQRVAASKSLDRCNGVDFALLPSVGDVLNWRDRSDLKVGTWWGLVQLRGFEINGKNAVLELDLVLCDEVGNVLPEEGDGDGTGTTSETA